MHLGTLYGVGIGPGKPEYLTLRAAEVLRAAAVIFTVISRNASDSVSQSVVEWLKPQGRIELLSFTMSRDTAEREAQVHNNAQRIIDELAQGQDCAFATLGDAMTYSTFGYIMQHVRAALPQVRIEIVPGITSFAALAAEAGTVLAEKGEQLRIIPSFKASMVQDVTFPKGSTTILLKTYHSRNALLDRLDAEEDIELLYGEHVTMQEQVLLNESVAIRQRPDTYLSLMMVKKH